MTRLADAQVLSAPLVLSVSQISDGNKKYQVLAFISVRDILRSFVERAREAAPVNWHLLRRMAALSSLGHGFGQEQVLSLHVHDDGDMLYSNAVRTTTMLELVRSGFLRGPLQRPAQPSVHRVGVFDSQGNITDIVSQTDVVAWLRDLGSDVLGATASVTLQELGFTRGQRVVTVPATMPTDQALAVIVAHNVSAVGVLDGASGILCAALSESDFRGCRPADVGGFALPVGEWLAYAKGISVVHDTQRHTIVDPWARALFDAHVAISLSPSATLLELMDALVSRRIHRVFITNGATHALLGVVTHTDVLNTLLHRGHKPSPQ